MGEDRLTKISRNSQFKEDNIYVYIYSKFWRHLMQRWNNDALKKRNAESRPSNDDND